MDLQTHVDQLNKGHENLSDVKYYRMSFLLNPQAFLVSLQYYFFVYCVILPSGIS